MQHLCTPSAFAHFVFTRIQVARGLVGVYFDDNGNFRVSPANGARFLQATAEFPDSVVGVYSTKISYEHVLDDITDFCEQMGMAVTPHYDTSLV